MRRRRDWAERLEAALFADYDRAPVWWEHDCCSSVARYLQAMTGVDMFAPFRSKRNRYKTETGAGGAIRRVIGVPRDWDEVPAVEALAAFMAERHGLPEVTRPEIAHNSCAFAQRGDPVLLDGRDRDDIDYDVQLGIVDTSGRRFATVTARGLLRLPLDRARRTWHLPEWRP